MMIPKGHIGAFPPLDVPAVILAGGLSTRLRSVLPNLPKPLAPVLGRPFLLCLLDQLEAAGARDVILCTGWLGDMVEAEIGRSRGSLSIRYSRESEPLGTAGAIARALPLIEKSAFLVLNGDSLVEADLSEFAACHRESLFLASILVTRVPDCSRFGTVEWLPNRSVTGFREKAGLARPGWINAGAYLFSKSLAETIPNDRPSSLERDILPNWTDGSLGAWPAEGAFLDIGTPESLAGSDAVASTILARA